MKLTTIAIKNSTPIMLVVLLLCSLRLAQAEESGSALNSTCTLHANLITIQLANDSNNAFSEHDLDMIKLGAVKGCMKALQTPPKARAPQAAEPAKNAASQQKKAPQNSGKESIFDRLLRSESKEPINPMQKRHRTGGK